MHVYVYWDYQFGLFLLFFLLEFGIAPTVWYFLFLTIVLLL